LAVGWVPPGGIGAVAVLEPARRLVVVLFPPGGRRAAGALEEAWRLAADLGFARR